MHTEKMNTNLHLHGFYYKLQSVPLKSTRTAVTFDCLGRLTLICQVMEFAVNNSTGATLKGEITKSVYLFHFCLVSSPKGLFVRNNCPSQSTQFFMLLPPKLPPMLIFNLNANTRVVLLLQASQNCSLQKPFAMIMHLAAPTLLQLSLWDISPRFAWVHSSHPALQSSDFSHLLQILNLQRRSLRLKS